VTFSGLPFTSLTGGRGQFAREQIQQQAVPLDAVRVEPVFAHHPNAAEADLFVAADRALVVGCRIDDQAVVAALVEQIASHRPDDVGAEPEVLEGDAEEEIHARVPVLMVQLLVELDHPGDLAGGQDHEGLTRLDLGAEVGLVDVGPPAGYLGRVAELEEPRNIRFRERAEDDALSVQFHDSLVTGRGSTLRTVKKRLDVVLVERGLAGSRAQAQALVLAGLVRGHDKPGHQVDVDAELEVERPARFVSRGGEKLSNVLPQVEIELTGRDCIDVGASTGGFTDCLLQGGAGRVIAVDVGYGQLHPKLRNDPRVVVLERTNARDLRELPFAPDLLVCDVSFISVRIALPPVLALLAEGWEALVLVKPQFEAGREAVPQGGVVRDAEVHRRVLREIVEAGLGWGATAVAVVDSGLPGPKGNREFFVHFTHSDEAVLLHDIDDRIDRAVDR